MEYIKIDNEKDILKIGLLDRNGKKILDNKGNEIYWSFDVTDIELPLKYARIIEDHDKNIKWIQAQIIALEKKEDVKGKGLLSKNEEEKIKLIKKFCEKETKVIDSFIGDGGVAKFLNGRNPYYSMFNDIDEALQQVLPMLEKKIGDINARIKAKYKDKEDNILE